MPVRCFLPCFACSKHTHSPVPRGHARPAARVLSHHQAESQTGSSGHPWGSQAVGSKTPRSNGVTPVASWAHMEPAPMDGLGATHAVCMKEPTPAGANRGNESIWPETIS